MSDATPVVDPPAALELLRLVEEFLGQDLVAAQQDAKLRFRVRVAANLLRIVRRELEQAPALAVDVDGYAVTPEIVARAGSLRRLVDDLDQGRVALTDPAIFELVSQHVSAKMLIAIPEALSDQGGAS